MENNEPKKKLMRYKTMLLSAKIIIYIVLLLVGAYVLLYKQNPIILSCSLIIGVSIVQIYLAILALVKKNYNRFMMIFDFAVAIIFGIMFDVLLVRVIFSGDPVFMYLACAVLVIKSVYALDFIIRSFIKIKNNDMNERESEKLTNRILIYNLINALIMTII